MPYWEFVQWAKYRKKRGSLNIGLRIDRGIGLMAMLFSRAYGKPNEHYTIYDFLPYEEEPEITLEEAMRDW